MAADSRGRSFGGVVVAVLRTSKTSMHRNSFYTVNHLHPFAIVAIVFLLSEYWMAVVDELDTILGDVDTKISY